MRDEYINISICVLDEKKMFNIAYVAGILVILVPWNSIYIGYLAIDFSFPIQQICLGGLEPSSRFTNAPLVIGVTFLLLGIIYVAIIRSTAPMLSFFKSKSKSKSKSSCSRRTWRYLDKLSDENLKNLPAGNVLTFRDTRILLGRETKFSENNKNCEKKCPHYLPTLFSTHSDSLSHSGRLLSE